jgi:osmotically-inducible protein OsmY
MAHANPQTSGAIMTAESADQAVAARRQPPLSHRPIATLKWVQSADAALRRAVLARLIADPLVSTRHINVSVSAGLVTLSGSVDSHAQKAVARSAARRVKDVKQLTDEVRVVVAPPAPSTVCAAVQADETGLGRLTLRL